MGSCSPRVGASIKPRAVHSTRAATCSTIEGVPPRRVYRAVATLGVFAGTALTLGSLLAGRLVELLLDGDYLPIVTFTVAGLFAFSRRPDHPIARRLLSAGCAYLLALTVGRLASYVTDPDAPQGWFWAANTFEQIAELAGLAMYQPVCIIS